MYHGLHVAGRNIISQEHFEKLYPRSTSCKFPIKKIMALLPPSHDTLYLIFVQVSNYNFSIPWWTEKLVAKTHRYAIEATRYTHIIELLWNPRM